MRFWIPNQLGYPHLFELNLRCLLSFLFQLSTGSTFRHSCNSLICRKHWRTASFLDTSNQISTLCAPGAFTVKVHFSAREKIMRIGQNGPLEKFMLFLFMRLNVACIANIWRDNICDINLCYRCLTRIIRINKLLQKNIALWYFKFLIRPHVATVILCNTL